MTEIAHIVNPVLVPESSDLYWAQPITFETMKIAKAFAKDRLDVTLYSAQFPENRDFVPDFLEKTKDLERSVLDFGEFKVKKKFPLLKDILDRLYDASHAEAFIYSNVDIALMPHFYLTVKRIIDDGYDAFVIDRRTISNKYPTIDQIPLMYSEIGNSHIGHDCFVFKREAYPRYNLGRVCLGIRLVGRVLLWNLLCISNRFEEFKNLHLTFHIGENKAWKNPDLFDYDQFNHDEALSVLHQLNQEVGLIEILKENYPEYLAGIQLASFRK